MKPKTLQQAILHFSDEQACIDTVAALRWPDGPICLKCELEMQKVLQAIHRQTGNHF